ncbi:MAG: hypothetical protein LBL00_04740 [Endomicrobium sp.]|nr:hypothetical protein [Endomicrobium sp.]
MEEIIDFVVDVFGSVLRKFWKNLFLITLVSIIFSFLLIPEAFLKYIPQLSLRYIIIIRSAIVILSFIFLKIFMLTIKGIKVNFNTAGLLFTNFFNPLFFIIIFVIIFGILGFIACFPFIFPAVTEKYVISVFAVSGAAGIMAFLLLPNAVMSLFFSLEGRGIKGALSEGSEVLKHGHGKIYFLMVFLALCALVLNITYFGVILAFPLIAMAMDQARESLTKIKETKNEKQPERDNKHNLYRPKVDYTKDYFEYNKSGSIKIKKDAFSTVLSKKESVPLPLPLPQNNSVPGKTVKDVLAAPAVKASENGFKSVFTEKQNHAQNAQTTPVLPETKKETVSEITASSEYVAPSSEVDEEFSLSDFIDLELYSEEQGRDIVKREEDIEIEYEHYEKDDEKQKYKSGKKYIDEFGDIEKKAKTVQEDPKEKNKRADNAKNYIENFGVIKKK